jgi:catechol 2,3-dioxygenase-like lactoylglutathione lyase family enzyme
MAITGLDHVQIAAPPGSEGAARGFYSGLLGLPELDKPEPLRSRGGAWFACGAQQLHVGIEQPFAPARKAHPALVVGDPGELGELAGALGAAGAPVSWDDTLPGFARFYTADPFGNRLELLAVR